MQPIRRRIEITTVTEQTVTIRPTSVRTFLHCTQCGEFVSLITPDLAAAIAQVFMRTIFQWVESGQLHFVETPDGKLLICLHSLHQLTAARHAPAPAATEDAHFEVVAMEAV